LTFNEFRFESSFESSFKSGFKSGFKLNSIYPLTLATTSPPFWINQ